MITLYMIKCQTPNHIYVGISRHYEARMESHKIGNGASFTRLHGVKSCKIVSYHKTQLAAKKAERHAVLMFRKLGFIVAGAGWTSNDAAMKHASHVVG